jgi:hypothetical protein
MSQSNIVTSLSIGEIYSLESEINGAVNQQTGEKISKGVLAHPLSMIHRYWLTDLVESISSHKKTVDKLREELIVKLGESDDKGGFSLPMAVDKKDADGNLVLDAEGNTTKEINPNFLEFNDEMNKLFAEKKEVTHYPFTIDAFDFKTDESYPVLFKLLKSKKEEAIAQAAEVPAL